jgi:hypothetical protein
MSEASKRSRLQFTLRTLLFVALCVAGLLAGFRAGWDRGYQAGQQQWLKERLTTRVYAVEDLVVPANSPVASQGLADFASLIELLTSTVEPTSWDDVGGPGSVAPFASNLSLVINQTSAVHEDIERLFRDLRQIRRTGIPATPSGDDPSFRGVD